MGALRGRKHCRFRPSGRFRSSGSFRSSGTRQRKKRGQLPTPQLVCCICKETSQVEVLGHQAKVEMDLLWRGSAPNPTAD
eukprot:scaffold304831_cov13-Tisochrysis_lutea.AAC.1